MACAGRYQPRPLTSRPDKIGGIVYVYELDPATRSYALTGIHHDSLTLTVPFHLDIDLTEIHHL